MYVVTRVQANYIQILPFIFYQYNFMPRNSRDFDHVWPCDAGVNISCGTSPVHGLIGYLSQLCMMSSTSFHQHLNSPFVHSLICLPAWTHFIASVFQSPSYRPLVSFSSNLYWFFKTSAPAWAWHYLVATFISTAWLKGVQETHTTPILLS